MNFRSDYCAIGLITGVCLTAATAGHAAGFSQNTVSWGSVVYPVEARSERPVPRPSVPVPPVAPLVKVTEAANSAEKTSDTVAPEAAEQSRKTRDSETVLQKENALPDNPGGQFFLLQVGEEVLRVDREAGTVSFCKKANGSWRCLPAPMAEEAYLAEIENLNTEIERLEERIDDLESASVEPPVVSAPTTSDEPSGEAEQSPVKPDDKTTSADESADDEKTKSAEQSSRFAEEEEELEEILDFTESAMRRFFGLMQDLRSEFEDTDKK